MYEWQRNEHKGGAQGDTKSRRTVKNSVPRGHGRRWKKDMRGEERCSHAIDDGRKLGEGQERRGREGPMTMSDGRSLTVRRRFKEG